MPPRDLPFGPDTLVTPAYLSNGPDDPGLSAWKLDHPDWFEAGTWTSAPRSAASERRQRQLDATRAIVGRGRDLAPLDPATISLADFRSVAAMAKQDTGSKTVLNHHAVPDKPHESHQETLVDVAAPPGVSSDLAEAYSGVEVTPNQTLRIALTKE